MKLDQIWIYPVKSLPGVRLQSSQAGSRGLLSDRRYMLTDSHGKFISIRQHSELYKFNVKFDNDILIEHSDQSDGIHLPLHAPHGARLNVELWNEAFGAVEPSMEASEWFSTILGEQCHLVYMPDQAERQISPEWRTGEDLVSFADGYAYLIAGSGSLADVSQKAGLAEDIRRFRPNIVVSDVEPYDELTWRSFQVGEVVFSGLKPCERCIVTTIDPDTLESGKEPLRTLARQKVGNKLVFGLHAAIERSGIISEGDSVSVLSRKESPYDAL